MIGAAAAAKGLLPPHPRSLSSSPTTLDAIGTKDDDDDDAKSSSTKTDATTTKTCTSTSTSSSSSTSTSMTRRMLCGGLAGMVAKTVTNPLERIKLLSQTGGGGGGGHSVVSGRMAHTTSSHGTSSSSIVGIYRNIVRLEGVRGLWAGNGANLLRIAPNKAVIFSTQDVYREALEGLLFFGSKTESNHSNTNAKSTKRSHPAVSFLAGGLAGMTATAATYPLDLARGRISGILAASSTVKTAAPAASWATATSATAAAALHSTTPPPATKVYTGLMQTLAITVKDEGIAGLYRGITPTLLGAMPYVGIQFGTVAMLERLFPIVPPQQQQAFASDPKNNNNRNTKNDATSSSSSTDTTSSSSKALRKMMFGGMGGVMAGLLTYPNDTVRRMLQLQGARRNYHSPTQPLQPSHPPEQQFRGYWDCVRQTYRQHGISRFYRGLTINLIRMAPNTAVQFGTYEFLMQISK